MKRLFSVLVFAAIIAGAFATAMIVSSADAVDLYTDAKVGDVVYEPKFNNDPNWSPQAVTGDLQLTIVDDRTAHVVGGVNSAQNWWGGEIEGLPLTGNAYTITFTVTREEKACFGLYFDGKLGVYGYAEQYRLMNGASGVGAHQYVKYENLSQEIKGTGNDGTPQHYAVEINAQNYTFSLYVKDATDTYVLIDQTAAGEIFAYNTDTLGIWFYSYYTQKATVSDITIYKGMTVSGEELKETEATEATTTAVTTAKVTSAPPAITTATPESTTKGDETTTAAKTEKSGCKKSSGTLTGAALVFASAASAAFVLKKRK